MQQYGIFQAFFMSFYSRRLYRDVANNWGGKAFIYLFLLVGLAAIPFTYVAQHELNLLYANKSQHFFSQMPVLTIQNGKISTPENRPYLITNPEKNEVIAVVDTTGKYKTLDEAKTTVLVTETTVITQNHPNQVRITEVPQALNMTLNPSVIDSYIGKLISFTWIFIFLAMWIGMFIYRILQALFYSIIGKIFGVIFKVPVSYGQVVQIALVSITPTIVLAAVLDFFATDFPFLLLCYFILAMLYLFYGVMANKRSH